MRKTSCGFYTRGQGCGGWFCREASSLRQGAALCLCGPSVAEETPHSARGPTFQAVGTRPPGSGRHSAPHSRGLRRPGVAASHAPLAWVSGLSPRLHAAPHPVTFTQQVPMEGPQDAARGPVVGKPRPEEQCQGSTETPGARTRDGRPGAVGRATPPPRPPPEQRTGTEPRAGCLGPQQVKVVQRHCTPLGALGDRNWMGARSHGAPRSPDR